MEPEWAGVQAHILKRGQVDFMLVDSSFTVGGDGHLGLLDNVPNSIPKGTVMAHMRFQNAPVGISGLSTSFIYPN